MILRESVLFVFKTILVIVDLLYTDVKSQGISLILEGNRQRLSCTTPVSGMLPRNLTRIIKMKIFYTASMLILLLSCTDKKSEPDEKVDKANEHEILVPEFQAIIDSADVEGAILMYDLVGDKYFSNDFGWAKIGNLPASTFKIANSIIALETGVVENESTVFKWNGENRRLKVWERDLTFRDAFHLSCVPCYQEVARKIGVSMTML